MIWILTIFIAILIPWSIFSAAICVDDESLIIYSEDDLILKIAKIYWAIILGTGLLALLLAVSYGLSQIIVCSATNNDYPACEKSK